MLLITSQIAALCITLTTLTVQLGTSGNWSNSNCVTFAGTTLGFEGIMILYLLYELWNPLYDQVANFSICCSLSSTLVIYGLYTSLMVGLTAFPPEKAKSDQLDCVPDVMYYTLFAYTMAATMYVTIVIACAVIHSSNNSEGTYLVERTRQRNIPRGLSSIQIQTIETLQIELNVELEIASSTIDACSICLCDCRGQIKQLPCKHRFHAACLDPWLKNNNSCALCRQPAIILHP